MSEQTQQDIRRLLKRFGIQADEAVMAYISRYPDRASLRLRLTLADVTAYGDAPPADVLHLEVEGEISSS